MISRLRNFFKHWIAKDPASFYREKSAALGLKTLALQSPAHPSVTKDADTAEAASGVNLSFERNAPLVDATAVDRTQINLEETIAGLSPIPSTKGVSWLAREEVNANFNSWLFARNEFSDLQISMAEQAILDSLDQVLASPQSGVQLVRRMPGVIPQLLQSLRNNEFSGAELSRKISHDVVLVAEIIRLANSSLYAKEDPITSIEHAVLVLGHTGLRHLITSVAFKPIVDLKSGNFQRAIAPRIWEHAEHCALAGRLLSQQEGINGFEAFLAGLLQNVGLIVALRVMDQSGTDGEALGSAVFCNALIPKARKLSVSIGREWNFPAAVVQAIEEQASRKRDSTFSPLGKKLSIADYLSKLNLLSQHGRQVSDLQFIDGLSSAELICCVELRALTQLLQS